MKNSCLALCYRFIHEWRAILSLLSKTPASRLVYEKTADSCPWLRDPCFHIVYDGLPSITHIWKTSCLGPVFEWSSPLLAHIWKTPPLNSSMKYFRLCYFVFVSLLHYSCQVKPIHQRLSASGFSMTISYWRLVYKRPHFSFLSMRAYVNLWEISWFNPVS